MYVSGERTRKQRVEILLDTDSGTVWVLGVSREVTYWYSLVIREVTYSSTYCLTSLTVNPLVWVFIDPWYILNENSLSMSQEVPSLLSFTRRSIRRVVNIWPPERSFLVVRLGNVDTWWKSKKQTISTDSTKDGRTPHRRGFNCWSGLHPIRSDLPTSL